VFYVGHDPSAGFADLLCTAGGCKDPSPPGFIASSDDTAASPAGWWQRLRFSTDMFAEAAPCQA